MRASIQLNVLQLDSSESIHLFYYPVIFYFFIFIFNKDTYVAKTRDDKGIFLYHSVKKFDSVIKKLVSTLIQCLDTSFSLVVCETTGIQVRTRT